MAKNPNWTKEEDKILRENYENGDKEYILSVLYNRNWVGIQSRASKFKLERLNYFSDKELDFIRENYLSMRSGEISKLMGRSKPVIERKARELGITKKSRWKKEEEHILLSNFNILSLGEIAIKIGKSISSIYHRVQELGLQRKTERYGMSDEELIENLVSVSKEIDRTPNRNELTKLGLPSEMVFSSRFGSYGNACELANLEINTGITDRKKYYSKNGDLCLSNAEKKITDFLIDHNISYVKEVPYYKIFDDTDCGKMLTDWLFDDGTVIEYFGMDRHKKYKEKMNRKIELCKKHRVKLIQILDKDLNRLEEIFKYYI